MLLRTWVHFSFCIFFETGLETDFEILLELAALGALQDGLEIKHQLLTDPFNLHFLVLILLNKKQDWLRSASSAACFALVTLVQIVWYGQYEI